MMTRYVPGWFVFAVFFHAPSWASAAEPTVLEIRWKVTLPDHLDGGNLTKQEKAEWHDGLSTRLAGRFREDANASFFAFWTFDKLVQSAKRWHIVIVVEPSKSLVAPAMLYGIEIRDPDGTLTGQKLPQRLFEGTAYDNFARNVDFAKEALEAEVTRILFEDKRGPFRDLLKSAPVATGFEHLADNELWRLPLLFDKRLADVYRSEFELTYQQNGSDKVIGAKGEKQDGNPPQLVVKSYAKITPPPQLGRTVKLIRVHSQIESGNFDQAP